MEASNLLETKKHCRLNKVMNEHERNYYLILKIHRNAN
jgi:hypothetical protein